MKIFFLLFYSLGSYSLFMYIISDLHLHSRFSRAVSREMTIAGIAQWAAKKGIGLVATGDWTHPMWMREIGEKLEETGTGLLRSKNPLSGFGSPLSDESLSVYQLTGKQKTEKQESENRQQKTDNLFPLFLLSTEISCIYSQTGKTRRVHVMVWVSSIASAQKISRELTKRGCNLLSDGRPIIGLSLMNLAELVFSVDSHALIIPAHIWTPWFSVYGQMGGFDSLEEAFGPYVKNIYAVETGLSSSPDMNWRIKELDSRAIVSFSDAHSGPKMGREATVFELTEPTFENVRKAIMTLSGFSFPLSDKSQSVVSGSGLDTDKQNTDKQKSDNRQQNTDNRILYTIEFYPEEGKYHYTGHRDCHVRLSPQETIAKGTMCPVCGKPLTQGVMQRVEELASRSSYELRVTSYELNSLRMLKTEEQMSRPPFVMLVPLQEIIAEAIGSPVASVKTQSQYNILTLHFNGEFNVLLNASLDEIGGISTKEIADGVRKVRIGDIMVDPGYDGVFGVVKIWKSDEEKSLVDRSKEQLGLF